MLHFQVLESARLDQFLSSQLPSYSRSQLQKQISAGRVRVDGRLVTVPHDFVHPKAEVSFLEPEPAIFQPDSAAQPLQVLFEDQYLLAIDKPVKMVVHPTSFHQTGTLVQAVVAQYPEVAQAIYDSENSVSQLRPGIVHRLDRDTAGVILIAKSKESMAALSLLFQNHQVKKCYEAFLLGSLAGPLTVDAPLIRRGSSKENLMTVSPDPKRGKEAKSQFKPKQTYQVSNQKQISLVEIEISTGRTHQIRVHAKHIGHPVLGDDRYGNKTSLQVSQSLGLTHQALIARQLDFTHPFTHQSLSILSQRKFEPPLQGLI